MFRIINNLKNLSLDISPVVTDTFNVISVRWRRNPRKPIWKGTAKSKIFRVPPRPNIPEEERLEITRLYNKYRTEVKSINNYLTSKYNVENQQEDDKDLKQKQFEADLAACMKLNDEWNAKQKILRRLEQLQSYRI
ncbi:hypothetical protein WA026_003626 [Henosepilachna vigintioctopunctata]|uniref:Small ribosomal subunit protein mS26 n=1 Tax=Henosepilachna vigintioctopunctata TaxID=420089 RepID=A0AAW1TMN6_9CUCU